MKKKFFIFFIICLIGLIVFFLGKNLISEEERVKKTLKIAEESLEKKELSTFIKQISFEYKDSFGFTYATLYFFVKDILNRYDKIKISLSQITPRIEGKEAEIKLIGEGKAIDFSGNSVREVGRFIIRMKKEGNRWKIVYFGEDEYSFQ